jgi:hypothetical protein
MVPMISQRSAGVMDGQKKFSNQKLGWTFEVEAVG